MLKRARKRCPSPVVLYATNETPTKPKEVAKPSKEAAKPKEVKSRQKPLLEIQMAQPDVVMRGKRTRTPVVEPEVPFSYFHCQVFVTEFKKEQSVSV